MVDDSFGLEMRRAHYPNRAPIDAYGNGGFRFAGMSHRGSIQLLPSGIYAWAAETPDDLAPPMFERIVEESAGIEVLLIGTGKDLRPISPELRDYFTAALIRADCMSTGAAVRTYNVLLAEDRAVAAALLAV